MTTSQIDLTLAKTNPSKVFASPTDVLAHTELDRDTKIEILRQWETDARLLAVADDENMQGGETSRLGAVVSALLALEDEQKTRH